MIPWTHNFFYPPAPLDGEGVSLYFLIRFEFHFPYNSDKSDSLFVIHPLVMNANFKTHGLVDLT